ncbi:family 16 glycosylhydrolase [Bacillus sp. SM2101]|uniref:family 16 glycosylhydrolase n=1 Tax=Bacillus sp. SM2101 TaxID=2805366 RepID=UPI001BDEA9DA|nr:family 16 glycosylhydrolase [Bacillus sp. SM2101]
MKKISFIAIIMFIIISFVYIKDLLSGGGELMILDNGYAKGMNINNLEIAVEAGSTHGSTKVIANAEKGNHLVVIISQDKVLERSEGEFVPAGKMSINPYQSGDDISGVDDSINKYIAVYEANNRNQVVKAALVQLNKHQITPEKWDLVWGDEFDGEDIDISKWNYIEAGNGFGNNELQFYTSRQKNARLDGKGNLIIEAHMENYEQREYTSAKLTTEGKGDWTYGKFEIRAKLPEGQGIWPAIWMMPTDYEMYGKWPSSGEIDIMELLGHKPGTVHGTIHYGVPWTHTGGFFTLPNEEKFSEDFHVFSIVWEPGEIRWYVDGILYLKQQKWFSKQSDANEKFNYPAPFNRDFYIQLNLAVGGNWPGSPDETTLFPQQFLIDYVRVYQLDGEYRQVDESLQSGY